ncbi:MAG: hypothetical protein AABY04_00710 [Candidatus Micrarchaeota archaeon]
MEFFILDKAHYSKVISKEDEFYYPLIFQTPLLNSRYLGKTAEIKLRHIHEPYSGILIGVSQRSLLLHFKRYFGEEQGKLNASTLEVEEDEHEWLIMHKKISKGFNGVKYISRPLEPPYYFLITEENGLIVISSFSESEMEDLPKINYNKIITNEAIEGLASYVKGELPKRDRSKKAKTQKPKQAEKQVRISKFL